MHTETIFFLTDGSSGVVLTHVEDAAAAAFIYRALLDVRVRAVPKEQARVIIDSQTTWYFLNADLVAIATEVNDKIVLGKIARAALFAWGHTFLTWHVNNFVETYSHTESIDGDSLALYSTDPTKYVETYATALGIEVNIAKKQVEFDLAAVGQVLRKGVEHRVRHLASLKQVSTKDQLQQWAQTVVTDFYEVGKL